MLKTVFSAPPIHLLMSSLKAANWSEKHNKTLESTIKKWRGKNHALRQPQMGRGCHLTLALTGYRAEH